ncbi:MAG TPA: hypothetical protein VMW72_10675 [Sedimentisphaerales bacterium]|nr:hypothetical protein [Sedimentisphaerales bacterium]
MNGKEKNGGRTNSGEMCKSPLTVIAHRSKHCEIEGTPKPSMIWVVVNSFFVPPDPRGTQDSED